MDFFQDALIAIEDTDVAWHQAAVAWKMMKVMTTAQGSILKRQRYQFLMLWDDQCH